MPQLGLGLNLNKMCVNSTSPAKKAGAVMHLDVSDLVSPSVIRDKQQGNNATMYNFAGTADSGVINVDSRVTQLVNLLGSDGNFEVDSNSDGLADGWATSSTTNLAISSNVQTFRAVALNASVRHNFTSTSGNMLYWCLYLKASSTSVIVYDTHTNTPSIPSDGSNTFQLLSSIGTSDGAGWIYIEDKRASGWTDTQVKLAHIIDLTQIFGAGNEPSQADMDKMIRGRYETGGTYIGSISPSLASLKPCVNTDGIDDFARVLTQSAGVNITNEPFALSMTLWFKSTTSGWLISKNTSTSSNTQYGINTLGGGGGGFTLWLNGSVRLSIEYAVVINTWNDIVFLRESGGVLKLYINGTQHATTASYTDALTTADNLTLFARSNGTTGVFPSSVYANNISIYSGLKATIANIKKHRAPLCAKYGITYA